MSRKLYALLAIVVLMVTLVLVMPALLQAQQQDGSPDLGGGGFDLQEETAVDGGAVVKVYTKTNDAPATIGEGTGFVPVPGMARTISWGGTAGQETLIVTFSAEAQLRGPESGDFDWIEIEVRLDGVPMEPHDAGSPTALTGNENYGLYSGTFVKRVGPGTHTVQVFWKLVDNGANNDLSGWIDDTTLLIMRAK